MAIELYFHVQLSAENKELNVSACLHHFGI